MASLRGLGLLVVALAIGVSAQSKWTWRSPLPTGESLLDVVQAGPRYIAVGTLGTVVTSTDGIDWTPRATPSRNHLYGIAWSGQLAVAVGEKGTILSSADGNDWTSRGPGPDVDLREVLWNGKQFLAVGVGDSIFTSLDGAQWALRTRGLGGTLNSVVWTGTYYLGMGHSQYIQTSADGITWSSRNGQASINYSGVAWSGTTFVAVGRDLRKEYEVYTSDDGLAWTRRRLDSLIVRPMTSVVWTGKEFIAIDQERGTYRSDDGVKWTRGPILEGDTWLTSLAWTGSQLVAVGTSGTLHFSADGTSWARRTLGTTDRLNSVIWTGTQFVAVGLRQAILTSPDGIHWTSRRSAMKGSLRDVVWTGAQLVSVGYDAAPGSQEARQLILTSPDGIAWTSQTLPNTISDLSAVLWTGKTIYVVGNTEKILSSGDGVAWTMTTSGNHNGMKDVATSGSLLVAVGQNFSVSSPDGAAWTQRNTAIGLNQVSWTGSRFLGITGGIGFDFYTSENGLDWTPLVVQRTEEFQAVVQAGGRMMAQGFSGDCHVSTDGLVWTRYPRMGTVLPTSMAWDGRRFVAVGDDGAILTSEDESAGIRWTDARVPRGGLELRLNSGRLLAYPPGDFRGPGLRAAIYSGDGRMLDESVSKGMQGAISLPIHRLGRGMYILEVLNGSNRLAAPFRILP